MTERRPLRILGLDPGSLNLGIALVERTAKGFVLVHAETLVARAKPGRSFYERMGEMVSLTSERLDRLLPDVVAIEAGFTGKNAFTSGHLHEMRGAVVALCLARKLVVTDYAPAQVKAAVTGSGRSDKEQVKKTLALELVLPDGLGFDATDAIAVALCHWYLGERMLRQQGDLDARVPRRESPR